MVETPAFAGAGPGNAPPLLLPVSRSIQEYPRMVTFASVGGAFSPDLTGPNFCS